MRSKKLQKSRVFGPACILIDLISSYQYQHLYHLLSYPTVRVTATGNYEI